MLPVDEVRIDPVAINNIDLSNSIYTKEQLEEIRLISGQPGDPEGVLGGDGGDGLHREKQEG
jgi:hypothetical protein